MPPRRKTDKPPDDKKTSLRCNVSPEFGRVVDALLAAPPYNGETVQNVLVRALVSYIPAEQWQRACAFVQASPVELQEDHIVRKSA